MVEMAQSPGGKVPIRLITFGWFRNTEMHVLESSRYRATVGAPYESSNGAGGVEPCTGLSNVGSSMCILSKKFSGQSAGLIVSKLTSSPCLRMDTVGVS